MLRQAPRPAAAADRPHRGRGRGDRHVGGGVDRRPPSEADALRLRTDGNPFFLVEYARLAREGGDLAALLAEENPPAAVQDVLTRRFARLPERDGRVLRTPRGRSPVRRPTLAAVLDHDEDDVLDHLDAALAAGLVREFGVDRFRFAHALVRDTVYAATLAQSRRGRMHARAGRGARRHRRPRERGGPPLARRRPAARAEAWRAASRPPRPRAAGLRLRGGGRAADRSARRVWTMMPTRPPEDDVRPCSSSSPPPPAHRQLVDLRTIVHRALAIAEGLDDGWTGARGGHAVDHQGAVAGRASTTRSTEVVAMPLRRLPRPAAARDSVARCRVMVGLASEIYYTSTRPEREALCEEALAMARRLGDDARAAAHPARDAPRHRGARPAADFASELTGEAAEIARELGDGLALRRH